jgi:hypothetical protein
MKPMRGIRWHGCRHRHSTRRRAANDVNTILHVRLRCASGIVMVPFGFLEADFGAPLRMRGSSRQWRRRGFT